MNDLQRWPRPTLAVDLVLFTLDAEGSRLGVVVVDDGGRRALPGRLVRERQRVPEAVRDLLNDKLDLRPAPRLELLPLGVYDAPDRDDRGWVISVAHFAALHADDAGRLPADRTVVLPLRGSARAGTRVTRDHLAFDHDDMVATALRRTRRRYERQPDPLGLLRPPYTLSQLRRAHEAVLGDPLKRDTFNRRMSEFLTPATDRRGGPLTSETGGRPAQLFRPASRRDPGAGPFPLPRA